MEHLTDEDLVMIFYNEPGIPPELKEHLAGCDGCRTNFESLTNTLRMADEWQVPEPPPDFERTVWARLAPQLKKDEPGSLLQRLFGIHFTEALRPRMWVAATAMSLLLIGAFLAGRVTRPGAAPQIPRKITAGLSAKARERILVISLADHLERAGALLTDLSNAGDNGLHLAAFDRERARDLVSEGRLMQQALQLQGDRVTGTRVSQEMLNELERLLLEVANSPDSVSAASLRDWREKIDSGSLLFKVRVVESNLRTKGQNL